MPRPQAPLPALRDDAARPSVGAPAASRRRVWSLAPGVKNSLPWLLALALALGCEPAPTTPAPTTPAHAPNIPPAPSSAAPSPDASDEAPSPDLARSLGQPCERDEQCASALCLTDADGYPEGSCAQACPCEPGARCVLVGAPRPSLKRGACLPACPDCRPGYTCRLLAHDNDRAQLRPTCVPEVHDWSGQTDCQKQLDALGILYRPVVWPDRAPPSRPHLRCHITDPVYVSEDVGGVVWRHSGAKEPAAMLVSCPLALALHRFGLLLRQEGVREVIHLGTTSCRSIRDRDRLSQHAFGNAIDVQGFKTDPGEVLTLLKHWERDTPAPKTRQGKLLWRVAHRLHDEQVFNIVLTPEYNPAHADHLHLDLSPDRHFLSRAEPELLLGD